MSDINAIRNEIKNMKPHIETKDVKQQVLKKVLPTDLNTKLRAKHARKKAHLVGADLKREISMEIKNKLSESFEFIEESCGSGSPIFEFYDEPQQIVSESVDGTTVSSYPVIGRATGVFAPIGVMSRNNRIYDNDHYDYLLENQQLVDRIAHRGMLGTIGHHDKKVDDQDLAEGKVSHIVSDLHIKEEADGTRNLYGTLEILDTPAGHLLKTYYDSGIPLFVSSRGGGNLLPVPNESYKRVDKTKYFLETFDIVKNPGFLQAKPVYEKIQENQEVATSSIGAMADDYIAQYNSIDEKAIHGAFSDKDPDYKYGKGRLEQHDAKKEKEDLEAIDKMNKDMENDKKKAEGLKNYTGESNDKVDRLISIIEEILPLVTEAKKEEKPEENEKKEKEEKKEAKEKMEAKEKTEAPIEESKKDKEKDLPEDEKNDDEESAVADSVTEEKELSKESQKMVDKMMDKHAGLSKADIAKGYEQTKIITPEQAQAMGRARDDYKNELKQTAKAFLANKVAQKLEPKKEDIVKQLKLGLKEEKEMENKNALAKQLKDEVKDNKVKEPVTFDSLDLARALKAQVKKEL